MVFKHKDPCATLTQAEYIAACGDGHIFACQATGDILYASSATVLSKLGKGAANTVLHMGGSCIPAWTATPTLTSITVSGAASSTITSTNDAACAIYLRTNAGTSETIKIHADQGTSESSIQLLSDAGGVNIDAATGKDVDIAGGTINLTSSDDAGSAVYIRANAGTSETIKIHADQGNGEGSIELTSDAGGIDLNAAAGKDIALDSGQVLITATHDTACTIYLHANGGTSETIKIHADQGTAEGSITILSDAGGIDVNAATGKDVDVAGGTINLTSSDDAGSAIYLRANAGTSETIKIHADQGSGAASICLTSDAGGITLTPSSAVTVSGALTVGVCGTGHDVKFFGCEAGAYMFYDQSEELLEIRGAAADAATSSGKLLLSTALTDINANDVIGRIDFKAPLEAGGTDAITNAASILAVAQATFSGTVNNTDLIFYTGLSAAACTTERFRFTAHGEIGIGGTNYGSDGQVLTSAGPCQPVAWEAAGGGGSLVLIGTETASCDTTVTVTGLSNTYSSYLIALADIHTQNNGAAVYMRLGDSGGIKSGSCCYRYRNTRSRDDATCFFANVSAGATFIDLASNVGNDTGETMAAELWLSPSYNGGIPLVSGNVVAVDSSGRSLGGVVQGRLAGATVDVTQVQLLPSCGNIVSGRLTVWGLKHA